MSEEVCSEIELYYLAGLVCGISVSHSHSFTWKFLMLIWFEFILYIWQKGAEHRHPLIQLQDRHITAEARTHWETHKTKWRVPGRVQALSFVFVVPKKEVVKERKGEQRVTVCLRSKTTCPHDSSEECSRMRSRCCDRKGGGEGGGGLRTVEWGAHFLHKN